MTHRSWMFVPGGDETKLAKAARFGADAVIVDLEDSVLPDNKQRARGLAAQWLAAHGRQVVTGGGFARWVRINPLDTPLWRDDLAAVMTGRPDGIVVPKATGPEQIQMLAVEVCEHESLNGLAIGAVQILPLVSETAAAALAISRYADVAIPRLAGLTWGAEDLSAAIGALRKRDGRAAWTDAFRWVRAQVLLTAHACEVMAVDTLYSDFRDLSGLERAALDSYADGFTGMLAIHPDQVPVINAAFSPSTEALARARAIVAAFAVNPGAGALSLDGDMIDQPHLTAARRLLERGS
ncbi:MAG: CoA ester lyase [Croceibacterium sp.]